MKATITLLIEVDGKKFQGGVDMTEVYSEVISSARTRAEGATIFTSWFQSLGKAGMRTLINQGYCEVLGEEDCE